MILYFIKPNFLILSTILIGSLNLFAPFISRNYSLVRSFMLVAIGSCFFLNILIIDVLFLTGIVTKLDLLSFGYYSISLYLEPIGLIFLNMLGSLWICSLIYTIQFIKINKIENSSKFLLFINLTILSGIIVALSANLFTMFIFYEILTLATIPLIAYSGEKKAFKGLAIYAKILMMSSMILFLPAMVVIYAKCQHGDFITHGFIENYFTNKQAVILLLMFIFGISKAALYPLHQWLPAAMVASYPVSAILHAVVVVKTGLFCIYKILLYVFGLKYLQSIFIDCNWLILLPTFTIFYASIKALNTNNIKMILAYSTISQLSIALLSAFMFTPKSIAAAMLHLVSHSFSKICIFYACGNIYSLTYAATVIDLRGMSKKMPKTSFILLVSILSLIGFPPFGGFISKFYIMLESSSQDQILVMIVIILSSIMSAAYLSKILFFIYRPQIVEYEYLENKLPKSMIISLVICLSCSVFFFFLLRFINQFFAFIR